MFIRLLPYFACCWEESFGVKSISKWLLGPWSIYNMFCWPMYTDLGRPGDTFAVSGRPSNLVLNLFGGVNCNINLLFIYYFRSHLVTVWTGPMLSNALVSSLVIEGEDDGGVAPMSMADFEVGIALTRTQRWLWSLCIMCAGAYIYKRSQQGWYHCGTVCRILFSYIWEIPINGVFFPIFNRHFPIPAGVIPLW